MNQSPTAQVSEIETARIQVFNSGYVFWASIGPEDDPRKMIRLKPRGIVLASP